MNGDLTPAFILHHRPFRETSLLMDLFSYQQGRISLVARGVRNKKRRQGHIFQLYQPLLVSWHGHKDLQTLTAAESERPAFMLRGNASLCGLYLNELLMRLLPLHEPELSVFDAYQQALAALQNNDSADNEITLRVFEKHLLSHLGYGLQLEQDDVIDEVSYVYQLDSGLRPWQQGDTLAPISGRSLRHLVNESGFDSQSLQEIKQLMRMVINYYLEGRPLQSRLLFAELKHYSSS